MLVDNVSPKPLLDIFLNLLRCVGAEEKRSFLTSKTSPFQPFFGCDLVNNGIE